MKKAMSKMMTLALGVVLLVGCAGSSSASSSPPVISYIPQSVYSQPVSSTATGFFSSNELQFINLNVDGVDAYFGKPIDATGNNYRLYRNDITCSFNHYSKTDNQTVTLLRRAVIKGTAYSPLRGIHVGDTFDSLQAKFPDEGKSMGATNENGISVKPLYGACGATQSYGDIKYSGKFPVELDVSDGLWKVTLIFSGDKISDIDISATPPDEKFIGAVKAFTFKQLDRTPYNSMAKCDAIFGTPTKIEKNIEDNDPTITLVIRTYKDAQQCRFVVYSEQGKAPREFLDYMDIKEPGIAPVRGIQVGDTLESVLAKFPDEKNEPYIINNVKTKILYGIPEYMELYGTVSYPNDGKIVVTYCDNAWGVNFTFDSNNRVCEIVSNSITED